MKKVLIYLNTYYHVETLLSIYASLININCEPFILIEDKNNILGFKELCKKYQLNLIEEKDLNTINLSNFNLNIIITGFTSPTEEEYLPPGNMDILNLLMNNNTLIIYHRADYQKYYKYHKTFFKKLKAISVCPFSQKFNLDFIYQTDNIITKKIDLKKYLTNDGPIKFLFLTRFVLNANRRYGYIDQILSCDSLLPRPIEINFIGFGPDKKKYATNKVFSFKDSKNIKFKINFNLNEIDFYEKINSSDFIFNTIDQNLLTYFHERFTSNITHITAFEKPNFSFLFLSNIYNIPGYQFGTESIFDKFFLKTMKELNNESYSLMCNSFDILKNNMYNHNNFIFNKIMKDL